MRAAVVALLLCALATRAVGDPERPGPLRDAGFDQRVGETVPLDVPFRDETGATVRLRDLAAGKPVLLVPAYFQCPMLCSIVLQGVVRALRVLAFEPGTEFQVVVFSFDPRDDPARAAAKKAQLLDDYGRPATATGWHVLTGSPASIAAVTKAIGFRYAWDDDSKQFAHASGVVVLTPQGRIAHYFYGVEYAPRDLRLAFVEAADERIGSLVDQLLLFCFHYDPHTGRYSAAVLNAIRVVGLLTFLALGTFVVRSLRTA